MNSRRRGWMLVGLLMMAGPLALTGLRAPVVLAQSSQTSTIATTTVTDTVSLADGTPANGTVLLSWSAFTTASGISVPAGTTSAAITNGALSISLVPNAGSTPMGSYYTAVYHLSDGTVSRAYWVVPVSQYPVAVSAIEASVLPTTVAMQTVTKQYVDTAIAAAVTGSPVDTSSPYVLVTGDTMTGALVLPGDPTTTNQAADKHYVDASVASVAGGVGQKVSLFPAATQVVSQPAGTDLEVNRLSGTEYASQYLSGLGNNGIANATTSSDCTTGCSVKVEPNYSSNERYVPSTWNTGTGLVGGMHVEDDRGGQRYDSYLNPTSPAHTGTDAGQVVDVTSTRNTAAEFAAGGSNDPSSFGMVINHQGLTGGSNLFPASIESVPYFKTNFSALEINGTYNTPGQHVLDSHQINCYAVGDCLIGSEFLVSSGGLRDEADEGTHPLDVQVNEDTAVFAGSCQTGCTPGSTVVTVAVSAGPGTEGEGRYLIDKNPAKVLTAGSLTGGSGPVGSGPAPTATFAGTSFPVSVFLATAAVIPSQANNVAPGLVTVAIATSGVTSGFATNTSALASQTGVACLSDPVYSTAPTNFETANYTVVDGTHVQLALNKPHRAGTTIAVGGLCGYGLEQKVDTVNGIRQVFPVIGSYSATGLYYAGSLTSIVGLKGNTSAYMNISLPVAAIVRANNVVTVTVAGSLPFDVGGLSMTLAGVTDASYNGTFAVTTTSSNTLTYPDSGANSTSTGGTVSLVTGGYALYPMAEVLGVFDTGTKTVDGQLTLAANTVQWAASDALEEPHYFQSTLSADTTFVSQVTPRPTVSQTAGVEFENNVGAGLTGWVVNNDAPVTNYLGNGGTHKVPYAAYGATGPWQMTMDLEAGEQSLFRVHCNLHGCGRWNSGFNVFEFDSGGGEDWMAYQPQTSMLSMVFGGTAYGFGPQGMTAGTISASTINATTINASTVNGAVAAAQLPLFKASGSAHAAGAVPDPGAVAGAARFLREDGTWAAPANTVAPQPANMPERANLLGEYLLNEGSGTVADDTSGQGNAATISGATWDGTTDLNFQGLGEYIQLPVALNATKTWQFAVYMPPFGTATLPQPPGYGDTSGFGANPSLLCGTDSQHLCLIASSLYHPKSMRFLAFTTDSTEAAVPMTAGWHIFTLICGSNVGGVVSKTHYLYDGVEVGGYVSQGDASTCPTGLTSGNYQIGGSSLLDQTWLTGKVAGAWAWGTQLSLSEASAAAKSAMDYIRAKGVETSFTSVARTGPVVLGGLDSRTAGVSLASSNNAWINQLNLTDSTYTKINLGQSGSDTFDTCAMFDLLYGPQISQSVMAGPAITVIWGGVNDFVMYGWTAQASADNLRCIVQKAKKLGSRVVLATEISSGNSGDVDKDQLDPMIRAQGFGWGVDNIADLATDPHIGADGASSNTTCFVGALHPLDACEPYITSIMSNAVNELIGSTETNRHATAAATYQEVAGDRFLDLTGTSTQTVSLPDCIGYSLPRQIVNVGSVAATVAPVNGEVLAGNASIAVGAGARFVPIPGALATGGCRWERTE